jgi:hypothetical protein
MGINQQQGARIMPRNSTDSPQRLLEVLGFSGVLPAKQIVNGPVTRQERKPIERLESPHRQAAPAASPVAAQGGLVDQLQGKPGLDAFGALSGPTTEQVPGSQTQVLRDEEPQARRVVADLIGESLTNASFDASWVAVDRTHDRFGDLRGELLGLQTWTARVEFFFEGRSRQ